MGKLSVKSSVRVATPALVLLNVMVRVETPPALMVDGLKTLKSPTPPGGGTSAHTATLLPASVTALFRAKALPDTFAPVVKVMLVSARIFPKDRKSVG
jgi:hypothetical protein